MVYQQLTLHQLHPVAKLNPGLGPGVSIQKQSNIILSLFAMMHFSTLSKPQCSQVWRLILVKTYTARTYAEVMGQNYFRLKTDGICQPPPAVSTKKKNACSARASFVTWLRHWLHHWLHHCHSSQRLPKQFFRLRDVTRPIYQRIKSLCVLGAQPCFGLILV